MAIQCQCRGALAAGHRAAQDRLRVELNQRNRRHISSGDVQHHRRHRVTNQNGDDGRNPIFERLDCQARPWSLRRWSLGSPTQLFQDANHDKSPLKVAVCYNESANDIGAQTVRRNLAGPVRDPRGCENAPALFL